MMPSRMPSLLIVEEALKNRTGHWYEYNKAIIEEARSRGVQVTILAHREIDPVIRDELGATPFFPVTSWDQIYNYPQAWRRYLGILQHNFRISRLLWSHFRDCNRTYDVVLVPTVVLYHWLAWRLLVALGSGKWFRRVVLTIRNNAGVYEPASRSYRFGSSARVIAWLVGTFRHAVVDGRVQLATDSSALAKQYEQLCGVSIVTYPHPRPYSQWPIKSKLASGKEKVFVALGPPRYEKGSDLIVEAIHEILLAEPEFPARFVLQWNTPVFTPEGVEITLPFYLTSNPKVQVLNESLSSADYQFYLEEADVLLLPYRKEQYHARLSGIAIECFQSGASCICVSDTWLEDCMIQIGSGESLERETPGSLISAIRRMTSDEYPRPSATLIETARMTHSSRAFLNMLMEGQEQ
jgi:glycosyltransferase involved in cell wall biosynthesis